MIDVNKTINKRKTNQYGLKFQPIEKQLKLLVYVDAPFGNLHDEESQSAYLIFFVNPNEKLNFGWQFKRIKRRVRISLATEALAMLDGVDSALYIAALLIFPAPIPDKEKKINLIFILTLLRGASKGFMKVKAFIKSFEAPKRNVKIKIYVNFYFNTTF